MFLRLTRLASLALLAHTPRSDAAGNDACWVDGYTYDYCCSAFGGRDGCFYEGQFSYFQCCLSKDGLKLDIQSLALALKLAPAVSFSTGYDPNCTGVEPWDELAITLRSVAGLRFSDLSPFKFVKVLANLVSRLENLGYLTCPLGVVSLSLCLMIMERNSGSTYDAFTQAVPNLLNSVQNSLFLQHRWPIFQQLSFVEHNVTADFEWSPELAVLRFICIPKTGGTTVENYGFRNGYIHWQQVMKCPVKDHCSADYWTHKADVTFCTVRNPYTRVLSAALWRGMLNASALNNWVQENVAEVWKRQDVESNLLLPSHAFVISSTGERKCNHVLRTENLTEEFCDFLSSRSASFDRLACLKHMQLLPVNVNLKPRLSVTDFSNASVDLINKIYRLDFQMFGYEMHSKVEDFQGELHVSRPKSNRGWKDDETGVRISAYGGIIRFT